MDGRYSLARYSVGRGTWAVPAELHCRGDLNAVAGAAVPVEGTAHFAEALRGTVRGTASVLSVLPVRTELCASVRMLANVLTQAAMSDALQASAAACKNVPGDLHVPVTLSARILGSKDLPSRLTAGEALASRAAGSKDVPSALLADGALAVLSAATSQTTETAKVILTIPPGGELRLDSEFFTALLDGENVLHTQEGDWIELSDRLLRLVVESVTGGPLEGRIVYTERFL